MHDEIKRALVAIALPFTLFGVAVALALFAGVVRGNEDEEACILVPEGAAMANFRYQDLPMKECAFCKRTVNLNRHHVYSQLAWPERRDDPSNLIVLCRSCHQVIGHKNNWKKFNPYVVEICDRYGGPPVDSREWRAAREKEESGNEEARKDEEAGETGEEIREGAAEESR